jgi:hypothetical protein
MFFWLEPRLVVRRSGKRGGGAVKVNVDETAELSPQPDA